MPESLDRQYGGSCRMARKDPISTANISIANDARAKTFGGRRGQQVHDTATERMGALCRPSLRMASSSGAKPQGKTGSPFQGVTARKVDARPSR